RDVPRPRDLPRRVRLQSARRRAARRDRPAPEALALMAESLLQIDGLKISIPTDDGLAQILDHVDLTIPRGRIVGVVGESGCGKSTLVRAVLGILPRAARVDAGRIVFG